MGCFTKWFSMMFQEMIWSTEMIDAYTHDAYLIYLLCWMNKPFILEEKCSGTGHSGKGSSDRKLEQQELEHISLGLGPFWLESIPSWDILWVKNGKKSPRVRCLEAISLWHSLALFCTNLLQLFPMIVSCYAGCHPRNSSAWIKLVQVSKLPRSPRFNMS